MTRTRALLPRIASLAAALAALPIASAHAANVKTTRPRLLLGDGTGRGLPVQTFVTRCTTDAAYSAKCQAGFASASSGSWPAIANAAAYVATRDAAKCTSAVAALASVGMNDTPGQPDAHSSISDHGRTMANMAIVRDWCDAALSDADKTTIEDRIVAWADWYLTNTALDVFHDDMNNVWSAIALAGLTLKGTARYDAKATAYLAKADTQWKSVIFPAMAYGGSWWHEGFVYVQPTLGGLAWYAWAWTTATDEDVFAYAKTSANDLFEGYLAMHAYAMRPDYKYVYVGDTSDNKQSVELFSRWLVDMMTAGSQSKLGQALSAEIGTASRPGYDYSGADGYLLALLYDASKASSATPRTSLPTAEWLGRGSNDVAILRSGWGKDDTFVFMSCGDYLGAHQHDESGGFQIFRHAQLTGSTGYYDAFDSDHWANYYSQHSVHANTLGVYAPGELFPTSQSIGDVTKNVNDGGERTLRRSQQGNAFPSPDLATYKTNKTAGPFYETGDMKTFEHAKCHDYVACDLTAAYDSPGFTTNGNPAKVKEVSRQLVFLRPEIVVVFDRVESTDPAFEKRFLLHAPPSPTVNGNAYTLTNAGGRLFAQTLLPANATANVIENFTVEGKPHPPSQAGAESFGTRLEIVPKVKAARDYFLHVLDATDSASTAQPTAKLDEDASQARVTIDDATTTYVVTFAKTSKLGGHVTVKAHGGATLCDQDLGVQATSPDGGTPVDPGNPDAGGAGSDGGANANDGGASNDGGCGCHVGSSSPWAALFAVVPIALGIARRRARARPHRRA